MTRFFGTINRRERWGLSGRGWILAGALVVLGLAGAVFGVHPFLAVTERSGADVLVVEGWMREWGIQAGAEEFRRGSYRRVFTTGGPVSGEFTNVYNTSANVGADLLVKAGVPKGSVDVVPAREVGRDRTYHSALALRDRLRTLEPPVRRIDVVTEAVHARRSRLLFQMALGDAVEVGVIGVPDPDYDPRRWWRYSEGVKDVISEGAAYLYARFFFHPGVESGM